MEGAAAMEYDRSIKALCDAGVEFMVIGGVAASLQGSACATFDLAIRYSRTPVNSRRLAAVLARVFIPDCQTDLGEIDLPA